MFCSTSVRIHLLRGIAALCLIIGAVFLNAHYSTILGNIFSIIALITALILLRGCPMCWLVGLFETWKYSKDKPKLPD